MKTSALAVSDYSKQFTANFIINVSKSMIPNLYLLIANADDGDGGAGEDAVNVIDIVDAFKLQEVSLDKKGWSVYIKGIIVLC